MGLRARRLVGDVVLVGTTHASQKLTRRGNVLLFVLALGLVLGVGYTLRVRADENTALADVAAAYLTHARTGRLDAAWALLSTTTRTAHPPGELARELSTPALAGAAELSVTAARASSPPSTGCAHATIDGDPEDDVTVFLIHEGGAWRVAHVSVYEGELPRGPFACP